MAQQDKTVPGVVIINDSNGHTVVERDSELKRLHYFDGKFLRAPDMQLEQNGLLNQIRVSNQAGGSGIVHGFSCLLQGNDSFQLTQGLAIDSQGRLLQLSNEVDVNIADLIARASASDSTKDNGECQDDDFADCEKMLESGEADTILQGETLYLIVLHYIEAYCGEEDVYGRLCESACVSSTQRPYILPGIEIRAVPLTLQDLKQSSLISARHLRSRVASAYFEMERKQVSSHISKQGLSSDIWCLGAEAAGGNGIPVAVIGRAGSKTLFLDAWSARRERMESPPRHYWAGRMAMRSWNIFLAQVLQFQCQLTHCISHAVDPGGEDPCADERAAAAKAAEDMKQLMQQLKRVAEGIQKKAVQPLQPLSEISIANMQDSYQMLMDVVRPVFKLPTRWLIDCGIVELPSGGYLPVDNLSSVSVNDQVQRMMGEGVDLRFCVVRPDYIPHALEEAQHMDRICLLEGIENPAAKPQVDVLVPEGNFETYEPEVAGTGYEMEISGPQEQSIADLPMKINILNARGLYEGVNSWESNTDSSAPLYIKRALTQQREQVLQDKGEATLQGAARGEDLDSGGYAFYFAGRMPALVRGLVQMVAEPVLMQRYQRQQPQKMDNAKLAEYLREVDLSHYSEAVYAELEQPDQPKQPEDTDRRYDMWMNLRCDNDPFSLNRGEGCNVSLELTLMMGMQAKERQLSVIMEFTQQGDLRIDEVLQSAPASSLRATLSSNGMLNTTMLIDGQRQENPKTIRINEQIYLKRSPGSQLGFTLSVPSLSFFNQWDTEWLDLDLGLNFERQWISATEARFKAEASFSVQVGDAKQQPAADGVTEGENQLLKASLNQAMQQYSQHKVVELLSGRQVVNADVLKPDHILHGTSLLALSEIGKALSDDGYADSRSRLLFPPPLPRPEQLRVFARHDWVMFHRRRVKQCAYQPVDEVISKPRRYRLLLVDSPGSAEELKAYVNALQNNQGDVIMRAGFHDAGKVEFEAGLQTILTSHSGLRADWDTLVDSDSAVVMFAAIASRGAAYDEGATLAKLRLQRTSEVLAPVTPLDEEGKLAYLNQLPDVLAEGDSDGVIIMVVASQQASATVCHEVYGVALDVEGIKKLHEMLKEDANSVLEKFQQGKLQSNAIFNDGSSVLLSDSRNNLINDWTSQTSNKPYHSILLLRTDPASGGYPTDQPYEAQHLQIVSAIAGSDNLFTKDVVDVPDFTSNCRAIAILIVDKDFLSEEKHKYVVLAENQPNDTSEPESAMSALSKEISFDDSGVLVEDEALLKAVERMKQEGVMVKTIEMVKEEGTLVDAEEKAKAQLLLAKLKQEGLAQSSATVKMRKPSNDEKLLMMDLNRRIAGGFVLKK